jgi:hypothetical protein
MEPDECLRYRTQMGRWTITTDLDLGSSVRDLAYDQGVGLGPQDPYSLANAISADAWFGISSTTGWSDLTEEAIPRAAATLTLLCQRFLGAAPHLLPR